MAKPRLGLKIWRVALSAFVALMLYLVAILSWVLLLIAFVSGPANSSPQVDRGLDDAVLQRFNPRRFSDPFGCTIVMAARNGLVLVGNNEDRNHPKTIVTFLPASGGYYGRVIFGYDDIIVQGGMNDQGFFIDGNSLAPTGFNAAGGESLPSLEGILKKYIEAIGGKEAIEKIRTRKLTGELTHDFPGQDPQKTVLAAEVIAAAPDKWRLILKTTQGVQQMGFDGKRGWTQDDDRILIDSRQGRSRLAYLFNPQGPLHLEEFLPALTFQESVQFNGRKEYAVKATGSGGIQQTFYFDAETGLLNRLGEDIVVESYRSIMGILHPVRIVIARRGGTSTYEFKEVEANIAVEEKRFAIPTMDEVFPDAFDGLSDSRVLPLLKDFPSTHEEMSVPCRDGRFLYDLILRNGYKRGLEIGSFTGYSALWTGWAFEKTGGKLIGIEIDSGPGEKARQNILSAGLENVVDIRIADAFKEIQKIKGEFDFVFIDAWKPDYVKFLNLLRDRVVTGGAIIGHNVTNYARDMRDYLAAIQNDPGLETTFEALSAEGMSVSIVRAPK